MGIQLFARRPSKVVALICVALTLPVALSSCGSYRPLASVEAALRGQLERGDWVRVVTKDGAQFTDRILGVSGDSLEFRRHTVEIQDIQSLERHTPSGAWLYVAVAAVIGWGALVIAMR